MVHPSKTTFLAIETIGLAVESITENNDEG